MFAQLIFSRALSHEVLDLGDETRLTASELVSEIYSLRGDVERLAKKLASGEKERTEWREFCEKEYHQPNYLWLEVIVGDGKGRDETIVALHEPTVSIENRDEFLALVKAHVAASPKAGSTADRGRQDPTIVSEILRVEVQGDHEGSQPAEKANVVWAGTHLTPPRDEPAARHVMVIAALDLDADLPAGVGADGDDRSPLRRVDTSPRHLAVLANAPKNGLPFTAGLLTYPDALTPQLLRPEDLVEPFRALYDKRDKVVEDCRRPTPPVEPRQLIP